MSVADSETSRAGSRHPGDWLDARASRRFFARAAGRPADADVLAREIARRMLERLQLVRLDPRRILDAGCGRGADRTSLAERFPRSQIVGLDSAWEVLRTSPRRTILSRWLGAKAPLVVAGDFSALPFSARSFDLVWSNLSLAWSPDPTLAFREAWRTLGADGLLMFATYGPDTLRELRSASASVDGLARVHPFIDMHDLGDMLSMSGFVDPVMDMEHVVLTYADFPALARDLRQSGQANALHQRRRSLHGRQWRTKLGAAYEKFRDGDRLPATFEIVYGHAWRGEARKTRDGLDVVRFARRG